MAPEAGWGNDPVRACRCAGLQAGPFLKKSCASLQPGFESSGEAAAAVSRGRKPGASHWKGLAQESSDVDGDSACPRVQARRRRRKHRKEEHAGGTPALPGGTTFSGNLSRTLPNVEKRPCCFRRIKGPCPRYLAVPSPSTSTPSSSFVSLGG